VVGLLVEHLAIYTSSSLYQLITFPAFTDDTQRHDKDVSDRADGWNSRTDDQCCQVVDAFTEVLEEIKLRIRVKGARGFIENDQPGSYS